MKIFTEKGIFKKLIIVLIVIIAFNAVIPTSVSFASDAASKVGGTLLSPVASLMIGLGDVVMNIIHNVLYDMDTSYILVENKSDIWGIVFTILAAVAAVIVIAVALYFANVGAIALLVKLGVLAKGATIGVATVGTIVAASITGGMVAGSLTALEWFGDNVIFPMYQISPEEIFKGEIALLDLNFFKKEPEITDKEIDTTNTVIGNKTSVLGNPIKIVFENTSYPTQETKIVATLKEGTEYINKILKQYGYSGSEITCSSSLPTNKTNVEELEWTRAGGSYIAEFTTKNTTTSDSSRSNNKKYLHSKNNKRWI